MIFLTASEGLKEFNMWTTNLKTTNFLLLASQNLWLRFTKKASFWGFLRTKFSNLLKKVYKLILRILICYNILEFLCFNLLKLTYPDG